MTDARYLIPLHLLPPVSGAPTAYLCTECGGVWPDAPGCDSDGSDDSVVVECLDLSRPAERDGIPVRLDVLPWALAVLAQRIDICIDDVDAIRAMDRIGVETWDVRGFGGRCVTILTPDDPGWEDYDPADPHQPRRIVAAVLRNHKEPTP